TTSENASSRSSTTPPSASPYSTPEPSSPKPTSTPPATTGATNSTRETNTPRRDTCRKTPETDVARHHMAPRLGLEPRTYRLTTSPGTAEVIELHPRTDDAPERDRLATVTKI